LATPACSTIRSIPNGLHTLGRRTTRWPRPAVGRGLTDGRSPGYGCSPLSAASVSGSVGGHRFQPLSYRPVYLTCRGRGEGIEQGVRGTGNRTAAGDDQRRIGGEGRLRASQGSVAAGRDRGRAPVIGSWPGAGRSPSHAASIQMAVRPPSTGEKPRQVT